MDLIGSADTRIADQLAKAAAAQRRAQQICARALTASALVEGARAARTAGQQARLVEHQARERVRKLQTQVANLEIALEHRGVIEQAKGILMARLGCGPDDAFAVLVRVSQNHHRKLRDVAAAIVADRAAELARKPRRAHQEARAQH